LIISKNETKLPGTKVSFFPESKGEDVYFGKSKKHKLAELDKSVP